MDDAARLDGLFAVPAEGPLNEEDEMRITHYGHACVRITELDGAAGALLIDPGTLAGEVGGVGEIDAVLITHEHPDHLDPVKIESLRRANPELELFGNSGTPAALTAKEREGATVLTGEGSTSTIAGSAVVTYTNEHATIYPELPVPSNNSYLVGGRLWHPGDAFVLPAQQVDVLLIPIGAPWLKLAEAVDYLRAVAPRVAIPIHQGGLAQAHRDLHAELLTKFKPAGTEVLVPPVGVAVHV